jgi:glycosyltransferase involved in cell wall biosynthesis
MPRVTAVIPSHNGAAFIRATIDSVLNQTYRDLEVVVADDGSSDGSPDLVAAYGPPVRLIPVGYGNMHATRNAAIAASDSELIGFLDHDDVWWPEKIERQLARFDGDPGLGLCFTATRGVDRQGREIPGSRKPLQVPSNQTDALGRLLAVNLMTASSVLLRRAALERVGTFDTAFYLTGDWDLWLRVAEEYPIAAVPKVLTDYRWHGENLSRNPVPMLGESIAVQ